MVSRRFDIDFEVTPVFAATAVVAVVAAVAEDRDAGFRVADDFIAACACEYLSAYSGEVGVAE